MGKVLSFDDSLRFGRHLETHKLRRLTICFKVGDVPGRPWKNEAKKYIHRDFSTWRTVLVQEYIFLSNPVTAVFRELSPTGRVCPLP